MQYATAIRDAQSNALAATVGAAPVLEIWAGELPQNCAAIDSGTLLAIGTLPQDWLTLSESGTVRNVSTWALLGQIGAGMGKQGTHFRIKQAGVCWVQGTYGMDKEMQPQVPTIANGQAVDIREFSITRGNA